MKTYKSSKKGVELQQQRVGQVFGAEGVGMAWEEAGLKEQSRQLLSQSKGHENGNISKDVCFFSYLIFQTP